MADPIEEARRQTAAEAYEAHMRTVNHMQAPPMQRSQSYEMQAFNTTEGLVWFDEATYVRTGTMPVFEASPLRCSPEGLAADLGTIVVDDVAAYTPVAEDFWLPSRLADLDVNVRMGGLTSDQAGEIEKLKPPPAPATKPPNEALARAIGAKKP